MVVHADREPWILGRQDCAARLHPLVLRGRHGKTEERDGATDRPSEPLSPQTSTDRKPAETN